jgi:hypothetical protein
MGQIIREYEMVRMYQFVFVVTTQFTLSKHSHARIIIIYDKSLANSPGAARNYDRTPADRSKTAGK